eukprot:Nk52_evm8s265 gene=Nk52_evmTU8s265
MSYRMDMSGSFAPVKFTLNNLSSLRPARVYNEWSKEQTNQTRRESEKDMHDKEVNDMCFSDNGERLVVSHGKDMIHVYNCLSSQQHQRGIPSKKYGVNLVRFTHGLETLIHTSTLQNNDIRYLTLQEGKYERYFSGHDDRVTSLNMCCEDDSFMSTSIDGTLRMWELRSARCVAVLKCGGHPLAAYSKDSMVFCVGFKKQYSHELLLYDKKNFGDGPFTVASERAKASSAKGNFDYLSNLHVSWTELKFSNHGKYILITTDGGVAYLVDAFEGTCQVATGIDNSKRKNLKGDFCPNDEYFLIGSGDNGNITIFKTETCEAVHVLKGEEGRDSYCRQVLMNPAYYVMASSSKVLGLWLPRET